jgi:hypothetical protein
MLPQVSMDGSGQFLASDLAKCKVKRRVEGETKHSYLS